MKIDFRTPNLWLPTYCVRDAVAVLSRLSRLLLAVLLVFALGESAFAAARKSPKATAATSASYTIARNPYLGAIVVEAGSGRVLFEDKADAQAYPASVLKLMDLLIILEKVERGELSFQGQVRASAKAAATPKSKVSLAPNETFSLDEMLYALMVHSANDVAVALAEHVAGSTDAFVDLMNGRAKALGMNSTVFHTVNGLPPGKGKPHDTTTARDIARLCREVLKHKDTLRYTATKQRVFRPNGPNQLQMASHNHLLGKVQGCDGLKTGYTAAAGFSIAVTASRNGQRLVAVVLGSPDLKTRDARASQLVEKGFSILQPGAATAQGGSKPAHRARARR